MSKFFLALDQGTTSSRAILYDQSFNFIAKAKLDITQYYPREGWVEHNPIEIWESQLSCCASVIQKANIRVDQISAIGITNQRETVVAWNKSDGCPVYNAIVWQDRRTSIDCMQDVNLIGIENNRWKTGLNLDAYFSAPKVRWILENIPEAKELLNNNSLCIGTVDSWLIWNLTNGELFITDVTNASRTNIFNIQTLAWDDDLLDYYKIPRSILPDVVDCIGNVGNTSSDIFGNAIPIAGIAGDQQAALFGHGCFQKGMMKNTFGTGCFLLQHIGNEFKLSENKLLTTIAWKKGEELAYALEGSVFNAGSALKWLKENLQLFADYTEADELAASISSTDNVYLVPAFTGLGAPYWDMHARGALLGLNRNTNRAHIIRATFESLAYQCRDIVETLAKDSGVPIQSLQIDGGVSKSPFLQQFLADILQTRIMISPSEECTALGVAMMAAEGIGCSLDAIEWKGIESKMPKMSSQHAEIIYSKWKEAVERSKAWA
jgi:glycerol kinase